MNFVCTDGHIALFISAVVLWALLLIPTTSTSSANAKHGNDNPFENFLCTGGLEGTPIPVTLSPRWWLAVHLSTIPHSNVESSAAQEILYSLIRPSTYSEYPHLLTQWPVIYPIRNLASAQAT